MNTKTPHAATASFVGTWELESFTEISRDGSFVEPMGKNPQGFLLYTEDGIVSAQLSGPGSNQNDPSSEKSGVSNGGQQTPTSYIGYCGSFTVNSELREVVHIPIVAHDRKLVGRALHRKFRFDEDRLTLKTSTVEAGEHVVEAQLVWRRHYPG
jgi:Lipocalin-like domain